MNHRREHAFRLLPLALLVLSGCAASPFQESEDDLGKRVPLSRLQRLDPLAIERHGLARPAPVEQPTWDDPARAQAGPAGRTAGAPRVDLTLETARAAVLKNNLDIRVAVVDPSIARERLNAERAKFEAVLRPSLAFARNRFDPLAVNDIRSEVLDARAGVEIPLRTGGRVGVDLVQARQNTEGTASFFGSRPTNYGSGVEFSITQPLLRNAGREVATAPITIASYNEQIAGARTKLAVIGALSAVERAYWSLYAARRELDVRQQQYELAMEQLRRARRRVDAGGAPEIERVRAESGVASRLDDIIRAENAMLIQQRLLKRLMNDPQMDLGGTALVIPTTEPAPAGYELDAPSLVSAAMDGRMELLETELALLADAVNIDVAKNQTLPALDLSGRYGVSGSGSTFGDAQQEFIQRGRFNSFTVGLSAEVPIGNEAAMARYREAILTRVQRLSTLEARRVLVKQEVLDAVDRLTAAWQSILATRQSTILAGRTLAGEQRQFDAGSRTSTDVLDAAARLAEAQSAEIRAVTEYQIALVDLAEATGTVLGAANVEWVPAESPAP
jgi:outer membrane protein TolC